MINSAIGKSWDEVRTELFTPQELNEMEARIKLMHALAIVPKKKKASLGRMERPADCLSLWKFIKK